MTVLCRKPMMAVAIASVMGLFAGPVNAHILGGEPLLTSLGLDMDGEANDAGGTEGLDWETFYNGGGAPGIVPGDSDGGVCTFVNGDFVPSPAATAGGAVETGTVAWKGGTKDFSDFPNWANRSGSASQKSDLLHIAVIVWSCDVHGTGGDPSDDHLIMQAFGDRLATSGNTFLGLWALQNELAFDGNDFTGDGHLDNDVLTIVNFPGNVAPEDAITEEVAVYLWNGPGGALPDPGDLTNSSKTIDILKPFGTGNCNGTTTLGDIACSIVNEGLANAGEGDDTPWPFQSNDTGALANHHTRASFVEMVVDLTVATGDPDICIATGVVETRQSASVSSLLDDLVIAASPTCGVIVTVQCVGNGVPAFGDTTYDYTIGGTVATTASSIDDVVIDMILPFAEVADADVDDVNATPKNWDNHTFNSASNPVTVRVTATGSFGSNEATATSNTVICSTPLPPGMILITKDCAACIVDVNDHLTVTVRVAGEVSNTGASNEDRITGFDIVETSADTGGVPFIIATFPTDFGGQTAADNGKLDPGETVSYSFEYDPRDIPGGASSGNAEDIGTFNDRVELQNITLQFGGALSGTTAATASCFLCVPGADLPDGVDCEPSWTPEF